MERIEGLFAAMRAASQDMEWPATEARDSRLETTGELAERYAQAVSEALCGYFRSSHASLWLLDGEPGEHRLRCLGAHAVDGASHQRPLCEQRAYPGYFDALLSEGVYNCTDALADPRLSALQPPPTWRAMLDVSGQINGKTFGVIALGQRDAARVWTKREELDLRRATAKACLHLHALRNEFETV
ncbi:GAF domain-containing protein [Roseateles chitinivorans]|uniref:GAF domain-containing protein n=1 Tax=Roseateles chitinivorans TaxID=2917965 RepID=UPI003D6739AE